jgi:hypothetical protein
MKEGKIQKSINLEDSFFDDESESDNQDIEDDIEVRNLKQKAYEQL